MRPSRVILGLLLAYQAVFLNVFLPGHTRGAVTLGRAAGPACCCGRPADDGRDDKRGPTEKDRQGCAVCHFAARVVPPPVVDLRPPHLGLLHLLPVPPPVVAVSLDVRPTYLACGPPAAHA